MTELAYGILGLVGLAVIYTYAGYPWLIRWLGARRPPPEYPEPEVWPPISLSLAAYNEEEEIGETLEALLAIDYPEDRRQIVVVSDASTDATDEIVRRYEHRGVELLRQPERRGKTAAEDLAARHITGDIVVNTDAAIRIAPDAVRPLVARLQDPRIGVASGRDVSVARLEDRQNTGESGYVGYEMSVRDAETRLYGIVGASGSLYAIRSDLHRLYLPSALSRDFAAALHAEEHGYRAVSVPQAVCYVARTASLQAEYRRKARTIERGMHTLWYKRHLLNPFRHPVFAWMLWSHKVARWILPWGGIAALGALAVLAIERPWAVFLLAVAVAGLLVAGTGWWLAARGREVPKVLAVPAYLLMGNVAAMVALVGLLRGTRQAVWEPTRRGASRPEKAG